MPLAGIEPALLAESDFESDASTSSAIGAPPARKWLNIDEAADGSTCRLAPSGGFVRFLSGKTNCQTNKPLAGHALCGDEDVHIFKNQPDLSPADPCTEEESSDGDGRAQGRRAEIVSRSKGAKPRTGDRQKLERGQRVL